MNNDKIVYKVLSILCWILIFFSLLVSIVAPFLLIFVVGISIAQYFIIKKIKKLKEIEDKLKVQENNLIKCGYRKLCNNLFIKEDENKLNINNKDYGFSEIINCELVMDDVSITNAFENVSGKIKNNGKISVNSNSTSVDTKHCTSLYINIIVDNLLNPNIKIDLRGVGILIKGSNKYNKVLDEANKVLATLQIILHKNKEKYIDNGTVTKVEHKYITQENVSDQIERLSQMYKDGILKEYEFEMKKKELLSKII